MQADAFVLTATGQPLARRSISIASPAAGEAIVEVDACGLCHTDLGFASGAVAPKHALPLVLGHEIVGKVVAAGGSNEALVGRKVLVPAVMGCGTCAYCKAGRGNACPAQKMPGNDIDGGFASHRSDGRHVAVHIHEVGVHVVAGQRRCLLQVVPAGPGDDGAGVFGAFGAGVGDPT